MLKWIENIQKDPMIPKIYANMRPNGCIVHLSDNVVLQKDIADYWPCSTTLITTARSRKNYNYSKHSIFFQTSPF